MVTQLWHAEMSWFKLLLALLGFRNCKCKMVFGTIKTITGHTQGSPDSENPNTDVLEIFSIVLTNILFWDVLLSLPFSPNISNWGIPAKHFGFSGTLSLSRKQIWFFASLLTCLYIAEEQGGKPRSSRFAPIRLSVISTMHLIKSKQTSRTLARLRKSKNASKGGAILSKWLLLSIAFQ